VFNIYTSFAALPMRARSTRSWSVTELGQIGPSSTPSPPDVGDSFYTASSSRHRHSLGLQEARSRACRRLDERGVLIDVAGLKGVDSLPTSYTITPDDLRDALAKAGQTLAPAMRSSSAPAGPS